MVDPREADRRRADRRRDDRRAPYGRRRDDIPEPERSMFDPAWLASGDEDEASRLSDERERYLAQSDDGALARVYLTYATARAAVGLGLVLVHGIASAIGMRTGEWLALVSFVYAAQAVMLWLLPRFRPLVQPQPRAAQRRMQWLATIGVDLVAFSLLHLLETGTAFNYAALLVLPVLMAGALNSRLLALGTAAGVALVLLGVALLRGSGGDAAQVMLQAGLAGLGLFTIALLAGELASRLARESVAARGSLELARQQAQLNRLVIEEMADGVLVIDRRLQVRAANPAARALLVDVGLSPPAPFRLDRKAAWAGLLQAADQALQEGRWPEGGQDVTLTFEPGHTRTLRMRVRFMRGRVVPADEAADGAMAPDVATEGSEPAAVLLLEDLRTLQARIRQEKLAAMGRVSAGIAHEIRNPLAAIAQANALMMEDPLAPGQQRLAAMVADNVERLRRLVDEVMEVAPGGQPETVTLDATAVVAATASEWARTVNLPMAADSRLRAEIAAAPLGALFDREHLRRVLVNLLDNAHRHASAAPGSIVLRLSARSDAGVQLSVLSDGEPIAPDIERRLFEPFFSTRSRGTGLGLYICRELCERHGASIEYRPRPAADRLRNEFVVTLRRAPLPASAGALPVDTA